MSFIGKEVKSIEILLELDNGDFTFYKRDKIYYRVDIEGYMGFATLQDFIAQYKVYLKELHDYLTKNNYVEVETADWNTIYQRRAIEICYTNECYWVFLDGYESTDAWDVYHYLKDVIKQIEDWCW